LSEVTKSHISIARSATHKEGEDYRKVIVSAEVEVPSSIALIEGFRDLDKTVKTALDEAMRQGTSTSLEVHVPPQPSPVQEQKPTVPEKPEVGSLAAITDEQLASELEKQPWQLNKNQKGWHLRWEDLPIQFRAKLATKFTELQGASRYVKLGGYNYSRYGDESEWLARYGSTKAKESTKGAA
jgi:hypothetical protein